jgi:hypothetical protein
MKAGTTSGDRFRSWPGNVALARDGAGKAQLIEHAQRPPIVRQGMRVKLGDTGIAGDECQMTQYR